MRLLRRIAALILLPYRIVSQRLAPEGINVSVSGGLTQAARVRTYAAPVWRRWVRWTVVLTGLGIYALMQLSIAYFIGTWQWWYVAAFFIVAASTALAVARPIVALIVWLVVSPFGRYFLRMDLAWGVVPEVTFDFVVIYSLAALLVIRTFINRPRPRKLIPGEWLMLGFVAYVAAGLMARSDATLGGALRAISGELIPGMLAVGVLYFVVKASVRKPEHVGWIAVAMVVFGFLMGLVNWYEHFTGQRWYSLVVGFGIPLRWGDIGKGRASGMFDHAAAPAALIATTFYLAYHFAGWSRRPAAKASYYAMMIAMLVGAYFTYTRNVYAVLALFTLLIPLLAVRKRGRFALLAAAMILGVLAIAPVLLQNKEFNKRVTSPDTIYSRMAYMQTNLNVIRHNLWFGVGYGNLNAVQNEYATSMKVRQYRPGQLAPVNISHNSYLTIIAEEGLVGSLMYFGAVAAFLARAFRIRKKAPKESVLGGDLVAALIASSLVFLASIAAASIYLVPYVNLVFWMQFAMIVRLEELWERERASAPAVSAEEPLELAQAHA